MNQITTHVLDTSKGLPAEGISISLQKHIGVDKWEEVCDGITNSDGRIPTFMDNITIEPGIYRMNFDTYPYFKNQNIKAFYPFVHVIFEIFDTEHYHVPLLLNPYGYSTYRGS